MQRQEWVSVFSTSLKICSKFLMTQKRPIFVRFKIYKTRKISLSQWPAWRKNKDRYLTKLSRNIKRGSLIWRKTGQGGQKKVNVLSS